jgi:hypothetical protein
LLILSLINTQFSPSVLIDKTGTQDSNPILDVTGMLSGSVISKPDPNSKAHYLLTTGYDSSRVLVPRSWRSD